jgi:hypothetical protein
MNKSQVQKLPMRDHNAPAFAVLVFYCRQATAWLNEHPANVVAVLPAQYHLPRLTTFNPLYAAQCCLIANNESLFNHGC